MRKLTTSLLGTALALSMSASPVLAASLERKEVDLSPRFTAGYETKLVMETTRTMTMEVTPPGSEPQENTTSGNHTIDLLFRVDQADQNGTKISMKIDRIEFTAKSARGEHTWKSTDPRVAGDNTNQALVTMRPSLGATLTVELDAQGNVVKADNGGVQITPGTLSDFIKMVVTPPHIRTRWSPILSPRKSDFTVAEGEAWSHAEEMVTPPFGIFVSTNNYTLKSSSDSDATITFTGDFTLRPMNEGAPLLFEVKSSDVKGTINWDVAKGMFKDYECEQRVELSGNAQGFPMTQRTHTIVKIRHADAAGAKPVEAKPAESSSAAQ